MVENYCACVGDVTVTSEEKKITSSFRVRFRPNLVRRGGRPRRTSSGWCRRAHARRYVTVTSRSFSIFSRPWGRSQARYTAFYDVSVFSGARGSRWYLPLARAMAGSGNMDRFVERGGFRSAFYAA